MEYNKTRYQELLAKFNTKNASFTEEEYQEWQKLNMEKLFDMMGEHAEIFKKD